MPAQKKIPAQHTTNAAALNSVAPPPGGKTLPTAISSTKAGSILLLSINALNAPTSRSDAGVSLKPPLPPFVKAVRRHAVTTICRKPSSAHCPHSLIKRMKGGEEHTSSGFFCNNLALAEETSPSVGAMLLLDPARWPETWFRRVWASYRISCQPRSLSTSHSSLHTHLQTCYAISLVSDSLI